MAPQPEQQARGHIDVLLKAAGWHLYDASAANIHTARQKIIQKAINPLHDTKLREAIDIISAGARPWYLALVRDSPGGDGGS